ncbi:MAG: diaminopimelate epimerase [Thermodesulfovibrionales bacterium]|nr:diaminopimelate epimerase [Thermodesulfovibrionales bacterium]
MKIPFTKMHGLGNDFILINCIDQDFGITPPQSPPYQGGEIRGGGPALSDLAKRLCDRRFGIGADQILLLEKSGAADFRMRIFNADGSEVEMCGNGIRCLAKYVWDRNLSPKDILDIETLTGIIRPEKAGDMVKVDMGEPVFDPEKIPVHLPHPSSFILHPLGGLIDYPLQIEDKEFRITCVSMGNPHAVIFVDNVAEFPVTYYGPMIERHQMFPKRTNVEFIEVIDPSAVKMRVWERGSGETMACGTGASAAAVAAHLKGLAGRNVVVHLLGGDLMLDWAGDNRVYMSGPAVEVFEGVFRS